MPKKTTTAQPSATNHKLYIGLGALASVMVVGAVGAGLWHANNQAQQNQYAVQALTAAVQDLAKNASSNALDDEELAKAVDNAIEVRENAERKAILDSRYA